MPDALIFDVDGTLSETEELHRQAFNRAFEEAGLPWHWDRELYRDLLTVTGGKERLAHFIANYAPTYTTSVSVAALHAAKTDCYAAMVADGTIGLRPGVVRLLREAQRSGIKLAIATTTGLPNVASLLKATLGSDAIDAFAAIGAGDIVAAKKPAPDVYYYVLNQLGVPAERCLAIEDSCNGLAAARAAGIPTVVTPSLYSEHEAFSDALAVLSDLGDAGAPYRHLAGKGETETMVTIAGLERWLA